MLIDEQEYKRLKSLDEYQRSLEPLSRKLVELSNTPPDTIAWLYTFVKWVRNTELVNGLKAREGKEIEIRDKMYIFFNMLLKRLSEEYTKQKKESIEERENMF